jgi:hypothetical protein
MLSNCNVVVNAGKAAAFPEYSNTKYPLPITVAGIA